MERGFYKRDPRANVVSLFCLPHSPPPLSSSLLEQTIVSATETRPLARRPPLAITLLLLQSSRVRIAIRSTIIIPSLWGLAAAAPRAAQVTETVTVDHTARCSASSTSPTWSSTPTSSNRSTTPSMSSTSTHSATIISQPIHSFDFSVNHPFENISLKYPVHSLQSLNHRLFEVFSILERPVHSF